MCSIKTKLSKGEINMEIIVGKTAGFCFGVKNAVTKAEEER